MEKFPDPQNNTEDNIPTSAESKENDIDNENKLNITFNNKSYELMTRSYYFEYPENIQEESSIIGYERMTIPADSLLDLGFRFNTENDHDDHIADKLLTYELIDKLSNGIYPKCTFNHVLGGHADDNTAKLLMEKFINNRAFLEEIYNLDTMEKKDLAVSSVRDITFLPFDKENNKLSKELDGNDLSRYGINVRDLKERIKAEYFWISSNGFNTTCDGSFWDPHTEKDTKKTQPVFGFYNKDSFFDEYLHEVLQLYKDIYDKNKNEKYFEDGEEIFPLKNQDVQNKIKSICIQKMEETIKEIIFDGRENAREELTDSEKEKYHQEYYKEAQKIVKMYDLPEKLLFEEYRDSGHNIRKRERNFLYRGRGENGIDLPILIGHKEIPQLRFGHASFCHFFNDKNDFNFIKFKHKKP